MRINKHFSQEKENGVCIDFSIDIEIPDSMELESVSVLHDITDALHKFIDVGYKEEIQDKQLLKG